MGKLKSDILQFLGLWESLHNPNFNRVQFDTFRTEAGLNRFVMTPSKWIEMTGANAFCHGHCKPSSVTTNS